jgi:DNA-binding transcriptional ArsR family regulator
MILSFFPLAFVALGLSASLVLFISVKRELRRQSQRHRTSLDRILQRLQEAERPAPAPAFLLPPIAAASLRPGLNVQRRVQALRLLRRGEDVAHIAAALGVPQREVELLIHVHQLSTKRAAAAQAGGV